MADRPTGRNTVRLDRHRRKPPDQEVFGERDPKGAANLMREAEKAGRVKRGTTMIEARQHVVNGNVLANEGYFNTAIQHWIAGSFIAIKELAGKGQDSGKFAVPSAKEYYKYTMNLTAFAVAARSLSNKELNELVEKGEIAAATLKERESASPATPAKPIVRAAQELFGVSATRPARRYHKSDGPEFSETELADRVLLSAADAVCNDMKKRSKTLSPEERETWHRAARFAYQARHSKAQNLGHRLIVG